VGTCRPALGLLAVLLGLAAARTARAQDAPPAAVPVAPGAPALVSPAPSRPPEEPPPAAVAPPRTPSEAAAAVAAARRAGDAAGVRALAAEDDPDPWLVAHELLAADDRASAIAFAAAVTGPSTAKLAAFVAAWRPSAGDGAARAALTEVQASLEAGDAAAALARLDGPDVPADRVLAVRWKGLRAAALRRAGRVTDAHAAGVEAATSAGALGWLAAAARALADAGGFAFERGDAAAAREFLAARARVEGLRGGKARAADAHLDLGVAAEAVGDPSAALASYRHALDLAEAAGDRARAARALVRLGLLHDALARYPEALVAYQRALDLFEALGDRRGAATTLANLGGVHDALGRPAVAVELHERALATARSVGAADVVATTMSNLGLAHQHLGALAVARSWYEQALVAQEAAGDRVGAGHTCSSLAIVRRRMGDWAEALELHERARGDGEARGDLALVAKALAGIGLVHLDLGNYPKALEYEERALRHDEARGDRAGVATTLGTLGVVHWSLGSWAKALELYERALVEQDALGDRAGAATTLCNLGVVLQHVGDRAKALETYERALRVQESMGDRAGAATTLGNIGVVHWSLGSWSKALEIYEWALAEHEALGDRAGVVTTLGNMALVYQHLGSHAKAIETFERALAQADALRDRARAVELRTGLAASQEALGDRAGAVASLGQAVHQGERLRANDLLLRALGGLARVKLAAGDARGAVADAHRGVALLETLLGGLGGEQGATAREQFAALFSIGAEGAARADDAGEAAFFLESGRAGTLLEALGGRESMRWAGLPDELRVAQAAARAKEVATLRGYHRALDGGEMAAIRAASKSLDEARDEVRSVVERIQRGSKRAANVWYPRAASLDEIRRWLVPGDVLAAYAVGGTDAVALRVTATEAKLVGLGPASAVREACEALDASDPDRDPTAALERLRTLLVAPLRLTDPGVRRVLVAPEGPLSYVPFAALLPDVPLVTVPSATTYGLLLDEQGRQRGDGVLALGDPDYGVARDERAVSIYERGSRLVPLPRTRDEAKAVGDVLLLGRDATEAGLREALARRPRWRAVHLACHGIVDPERPTLSSLALTPAGADDGYLTALEVLDLPASADLVVLSACETGRGRIVAGEGIVGLTRSFMFAGAPRVVCSLWKVDDEATGALMTTFYQLWNPRDGAPGLPTAEALRRAQDAVRAQPRWRHPYFWAAWVLWGLPS